METSYYNKYVGLEGVSISQTIPPLFQGRRYKELAPPWELIRKHKARKVTEEQFAEIYKQQVLDKLDANKVYRDLGENAVLLCWETPDKHCHRHLVREWLNKELDLNIIERY